MNRALAVAVIGLVVALGGYGGLYYTGTASHRSLLHSREPELLWLKKEFQLSDAEFQRVTQLHEAYRPICRENCRRIEEQQAKLQHLLASATEMTPEIKAVMLERARLQAECQSAMLQHFFKVSRTMSPQQGHRYLAWVQTQTVLAEDGMSRHH